MVGLGTCSAALLIACEAIAVPMQPDIRDLVSSAMAADPVATVESTDPAPSGDVEFARYNRMLGCDLDTPASSRFIVEQWSLWRVESDRSPMLSVLDGVFGLPGDACNGLVELARCCVPQTGCYSLRQEDDGPLIGKLGLFARSGRMTSPFTEFAREWVSRQNRVLGEESYVRTMSYELGFAEVDHDAVWHEEQKALWDVARRVYLTRYFGRGEERVREMWRLSEWQTIDFFVAPPVLLAYTWFRGWERRITMWDTRLHVRIEPLGMIVHNLGRANANVPFAVAMEFEIPGCPVRAIAAAGLHDGGVEIDFVGIGTSIGSAQKAFNEASND